MIRRLPAVSLGFSVLALAACNPAPKAEKAPDKTGPEAASAAPEPAPASAAAVPAVAAAPAAQGAPVFAVLYPDAAVDGAPTLADGGRGGIMTFTVADAPEDVIAFYRTRAEAAGLQSVMAMNQGAVRAYGASGGDAGSAELQVVASPTDTGGASVQLSWSAGR